MNDDNKYTSLYKKARILHDKIEEEGLDKFRSQIDSLDDWSKFCLAERAICSVFGGSDLETLDYVLSSGLDVNSCMGGNIRDSLLHIAVGDDRIKAAELLIRRGADINLQNDLGWTPLMVAVDCDNDYMTELLLSAGADTEVRDNSGNTVLLRAVGWATTIDVIKLLIDMGRADIEAKDDMGRTPLIVAAGEGFLSVVKILVEAGADQTAENKWGETAIEVAREEGHTKIVSYLHYGREED